MFYQGDIAGRLETLTELHLIAGEEDSKHIIGCFIVFLIWYRVTWAVWTPLAQFGENLPLSIRVEFIQITHFIWKTRQYRIFCFFFFFYADLSSLIPERRVQLSVRQQAGLQAGEELEEVPPLREVQRRSLDAVLADQNYRPTAVHWREIKSVNSKGK